MIRLFNWFRRGSLERGLARELQYHFDRRVADHTITGMLLTNDKPLYLTAKIAHGHGYTSQLTTTPTRTPPTKIAAKYLTPQLNTIDQETSRS